jgi:hypothetical protein
MLFAFYTNTVAQLLDYKSEYNCARNIVSQTSQIDADADSVYETYSIKLCGDFERKTLPLKAIGDIHKWPPIDIPTRSIAADFENDSLVFLETFLDFNGNVIGWFQKVGNSDTVYFHGGASYSGVNFNFDSSAYYIQSFPNPATDFLNIHYVVKTKSRISIEFLNYEGELLSRILSMPSGVGEYNLVFNVTGYAEGYYKLRFTTGTDVYTISIAIVR